MLNLENIHGGYLKNHSILNGLSLSVDENETLAIVGQNGAGKSTLAKAIIGMLPYCSGSIIYKDSAINKKNTTSIINKGIAYFMQGGQVFPHLSVKENLLFAGRNLPKAIFKSNLGQLVQYFEILGNNKKQDLKASYLSGGERHQLAMAMVLVNKPQFLILDEPSAGLSPQNTDNVYEILNQIRNQNSLTILLIEQNIDKAIAFSHKVALLKNGIITKQLDVSQTSVFEEINEFYFE